MRSKQEIIEELQKPGLIAVVRARSAQQVVPLGEALLRGGIRAIEVTMTTPNALQAIRGNLMRLKDVFASVTAPKEPRADVASVRGLVAQTAALLRGVR